MLRLSMSAPNTPLTCLQDLKHVLKRTGLEGRDTVFLFSDTQIVQEGFLEDINALLNAGEVGGPAWLAPPSVADGLLIKQPGADALNLLSPVPKQAVSWACDAMAA